MDPTNSVEKSVKKSNKLSDWALGIGVVSIFLYFIGIIPVIGIIVSIIAIMKHNNKTHSGLVKGIIGLILNILYLIVNAYNNGHIG
ncbi:hypothetical protein J45TS6_45620 [Paenibacillus sp. J45TS6]|uniref:hypothetical protein n=1 Tax=Paenibacillus sp. J45TS6 TaxID=2807196 RepID=UPI0019376879|nr:hypothetical protein [Paenibacillus sp. J45TS6]BCO11079.1 hypothetical protein [Paenibacillus sp.]GIP46103.1 hypothetical protein J45TS6_45620 [Paenibacillus sp. J45TS6]